MLREDGLARVPLEWRHAAEHLVEDHREGIDVRRVGHRGLSDLLGREVFRRGLVDQDAVHRLRGARPDQLHVHQGGVSVAGDHHIARTQRAVDEAHVVKRLHGAAEINGDAQGSLDLEGPLRQDRAQSATVDELHRREGLTGFRLPEFQNSDKR